MKIITIITKENCHFCDKALELLKEKNRENKQEFTRVDMTYCEPALRLIQLSTEHSTVPMIWAADPQNQFEEPEFIGGYEDLVDYFEDEESS